jgi:hypothetical protein
MSAAIWLDYKKTDWWSGGEHPHGGWKCAVTQQMGLCQQTGSWLTGITIPNEGIQEIDVAVITNVDPTSLSEEALMGTSAFHGNTQPIDGFRLSLYDQEYTDPTGITPLAEIDTTWCNSRVVDNSTNPSRKDLVVSVQIPPIVDNQWGEEVTECEVPECENAIVPELVLEDGTVLYPYPGGQIVTSECGECPSFESITPVVRENCNGCLELDLGDDTETFTYGTLFGQEDLCNNSAPGGTEISVKVRKEPKEPRWCHQYEICMWTNTVQGVVNSPPSLTYIFADGFGDNNIFDNNENPTDVKNDHKFIHIEVVNPNTNGGAVTTNICMRKTGTLQRIPYQQEAEIPTNYWNYADTVGHLGHTFKEEDCCEGTV